MNAVQGYEIIEDLGWDSRVLNHIGCNICNCPSNIMDIHFVGSCQIACIRVLPYVIAESAISVGPTVSDSMYMCCFRWIHRTCYLMLLDSIG